MSALISAVTSLKVIYCGLVEVVADVEPVVVDVVDVDPVVVEVGEVTFDVVSLVLTELKGTVTY